MRRIFAIAVAALLASAPAALAAPSKTGTVSSTHPKFAWTGTAYGTNLVGEPCNTDHSCEDILVHVTSPGFLNVDWSATAPAGPAWLGVTIFASDASGKQGDQLADGGALADSGAVGTDAPVGYYLVEVEGLLTSLANYKATATLQP